MTKQSYSEQELLIKSRKKENGRSVSRVLSDAEVTRITPPEAVIHLAGAFCKVPALSNLPGRYRSGPLPLWRTIPSPLFGLAPDRVYQLPGTPGR